jgi:hypothetical protein
MPSGVTQFSASTSPLGADLAAARTHCSSDTCLNSLEDAVFMEVDDEGAAKDGAVVEASVDCGGEGSFMGFSVVSNYR